MSLTRLPCRHGPTTKRFAYSIARPKHFTYRRYLSPGKTGIRDRKTGEALIEDSGAFVPISEYKPPGLSPAFRKGYFGVFKLPFTPAHGVGRRMSMGNQEGFLDGLCVELPITSYDVKVPGGSFVTREMGRPEDCVSFVTVRAEVLIQVAWNSGDNLDLEVTKSDGDVVSKDSPVSETGALNKDNNMACMTKTGKEAIVYRGNEIEEGAYEVVLRHSKNCSGGRTKWRLQVVVRGSVVLNVRGSSKLDGGAVIATEKE